MSKGHLLCRRCDVFITPRADGTCPYCKEYHLIFACYDGMLYLGRPKPERCPMCEEESTKGHDRG